MPIDLRAELNLLPATPRTRRVRSILLVPPVSGGITYVKLQHST
jgi:hypothetical protein